MELPRACLFLRIHLPTAKTSKLFLFDLSNKPLSQTLKYTYIANTYTSLGRNLPSTYFPYRLLLFRLCLLLIVEMPMFCLKHASKHTIPVLTWLSYLALRPCLSSLGSCYSLASGRMHRTFNSEIYTPVFKSIKLYFPLPNTSVYVLAIPSLNRHKVILCFKHIFFQPKAAYLLFTTNK